MIAAQETPSGKDDNKGNKVSEYDIDHTFRYRNGVKEVLVQRKERKLRYEQKLHK